MKAYLLFSRGSGPASAMIRRWTKSEFAHVAPVISAPGVSAPSANDGSLAYDCFWGYLLTERSITQADAAETWVELPWIDAASRQPWIDAQVGKPYDYKAVLIDIFCRFLGGGLHVYDSQQGCWDCSRLGAVFADVEATAWGLNDPISPGALHIIVAEKLAEWKAAHS